MHGHVKGADNLAWKQVIAMGRELTPEHPLFAAPAPPAPAPRPVVAPPAPEPAPPPPKVEWRTPQPVDSATTQQLRLDDVKPAAAAPTPAVADLTPTFDIPDIEPVPEFDAHVPEPVLEPTESFVDADAASTKLELARAYLDMGDVDGARGMLEEVVSEGNPGQRAEAKRLLDEIR